MKVATALPLLPRSVLEALGDVAGRDLYAWLSEYQRQVAVALNGGLELTENIGVHFSGTFAVAANTATNFTHGLGRVPVFFAYLWNDTAADLVTTGGVQTLTDSGGDTVDVELLPTIYTTPVLKALWTTDTIGLGCNRNTDGSAGNPNLSFIGWAV